MIGPVIYEILRANSGVQALIGNFAAGQWSVRVSPLRLAQTLAKPNVTYQLVGSDPSDTKSGASKLDQKRVYINCYDDEYGVAENVMEAVRTALDRYSGTVAGIKVQSIQYLDERDMYNEAGELAGKQMEFKIRVER